MPNSLHPCSVCLHQSRAPHFALKYPCNPRPRPSLGNLPGRPSCTRVGRVQTNVSGFIPNLCLFATLPRPILKRHLHSVEIRALIDLDSEMYVYGQDMGD